MSVSEAKREDVTKNRSALSGKCGGGHGLFIGNVLPHCII
jgi:hypothetical protein